MVWFVESVRAVWWFLLPNADLKRGQCLAQEQPAEQHRGHRAEQEQPRDHRRVQAPDTSCGSARR